MSDIDVRSLATEVGWSRRHLSERFRVELGLPPNVLGRVLRVQRARRLRTTYPVSRSQMTASGKRDGRVRLTPSTSSTARLDVTAVTDAAVGTSTSTVRT